MKGPRKQKPTRRSLLVRRRMPVITIGAVLVVLAAVTVGLTVRPPSHAATTIPEVRIECGVDHYGPNDPIVYPGQPGLSHMHSFYGNKTTDAYSTDSSIFNSQSSCGYTGAVDRSAYWIPSLYSKNADGTSTLFNDPAQEMIVYYRRAGGASGPLVHPFPVGLRMIAGDASATAPQVFSTTYWDCNGGPQYANIPDCTNQTSGTTPRAVINFPNCWDGVHLDSVDHRSHMAYPNPNTGVCPADHPVSLPAVSYEITFNGTHGGSSLYLSSGGVFSMHGDFIAAWDSSVQTGLIDQCMNTVITECHVVTVDQSGNVYHNGIFLFNTSSYPPTPTPSPTPTPAGPKTGDLNSDGSVNIIDLSILLSHWNTSSTLGDINKDGTVNILDLSILLSHWGT